jgi:hypothetical protein
MHTHLGVLDEGGGGSVEGGMEDGGMEEYRTTKARLACAGPR